MNDLIIHTPSTNACSLTHFGTNIFLNPIGVMPADISGLMILCSKLRRVWTKISERRGTKMRICLIVAVLALLFFHILPAHGVEGDVTTGEGRYKLVDVKVGNEMVPFLLDSRTGKVWIYQSDIGSKKKFVGLSVEGIAYSRDEKEQELLSKQMEQWHFDGYIDKSTKGLKESIFGAFSYWPEIEKVEGLYGKRKAK